MENRTISAKNIMEEKNEKINKNIFNVIKGSIIAIIISLILLTIYGAILSFTNVSETTMVPVVITISGISILIGSSLSSIKIKRQGLLNGALVGIIYMLVIYVISSICISSFSLNLQSIIMMLVSGITGMIGGIIGVNV